MLILSPADERGRETAEIEGRTSDRERWGEREGESSAPLSADSETSRLARDSRFPLARARRRNARLISTCLRNNI